MGMKPRRSGSSAAAEIVTEWAREVSQPELHAYRRSYDGVHVLVFVAGSDVTAEDGLGRGIKAVIDDEVTAWSRN